MSSMIYNPPGLTCFQWCSNVIIWWQGRGRFIISNNISTILPLFYHLIQTVCVFLITNKHVNLDTIIYVRVEHKVIIVPIFTVVRVYTNYMIISKTLCPSHGWMSRSGSNFNVPFWIQFQVWWNQTWNGIHIRHFYITNGIHDRKSYRTALLRNQPGSRALFGRMFLTWFL